MLVSLKARRKTCSELWASKAFPSKTFEAFLTDWKEITSIIAVINPSLSSKLLSFPFLTHFGNLRQLLLC